MNIKSRFKKILIDSVARAFKPRLINKLGRLIEPQFDLNKISGISFNMTLQPRDAAKNIVDYFFKKNKQKQLVTEIINGVLYGLNGEAISLPNFSIIITELKKLNYIYDHEKKILISTVDTQNSPDWGFLEENKEYTFCFASIDIVDNSLIVRKNRSQKSSENLISHVYSTFTKLIQSKIYVENTSVSKPSQINKNHHLLRDGRLWLWEGDGGIVAFQGKNAVNQAVYSMVDLILTMPVFNAIYNKLFSEIKIRIAIHPGPAIFKKDVNLITSEALDVVKSLEKKHTPVGSISISNSGWKSLNNNLQSLFGQQQALGAIGIQTLNLPMGRNPNE